MTTRADQAATGRSSVTRSRWAAIGAALAVAVGAGGLLTASAADSVPTTYVAITPCRVVDTRAGADNVGPRATPIGDAETYSTPFVGAVGKCNIPANAVAVVLNLAIVNPTGNSFLTVFPAGSSVPLAANLNYAAGQAPASNAATVQIGAGGQLSFFNLRGTVDVTADVSGYYLPAGSKQQTIVFSTNSISWYAAGFSSYSINGCASQQTGTAWGFIPLDLPIGAQITGISASVWDAATTQAYRVELQRRRVGGSAVALTTRLLEINGGSVSGAVSVGDVSSPTAFTVTATDTYHLFVDLGAPLSNGLCSASITVTMP
jgi:hypothetical protein